MSHARYDTELREASQAWPWELFLSDQVVQVLQGLYSSLRPQFCKQLKTEVTLEMYLDLSCSALNFSWQKILGWLQCLGWKRHLVSKWKGNMVSALCHEGRSATTITNDYASSPADYYEWLRQVMCQRVTRSYCEYFGVDMKLLLGSSSCIVQYRGSS